MPLNSTKTSLWIQDYLIHPPYTHVYVHTHVYTHTGFRLLIRQVAEQAGFIQHKLPVLFFTHTFFIGGTNTLTNKTHLLS